MGKSRPLARPVTQPQLLKSELISILKQIRSLQRVHSLLLFNTRHAYEYAIERFSEVFHLLYSIVSGDEKGRSCQSS